MLAGGHASTASVIMLLCQYLPATAATWHLAGLADSPDYAWHGACGYRTLFAARLVAYAPPASAASAAGGWTSCLATQLSEK
jgi:hypothetical protein